MGINRDYQKRLNDIIVSDNSDCVNGLEKLVKSEILNVLKNYFVVTNDGLELEIVPELGGKYKINFNAEIMGVKKIKKII
jgi:septum formation topological specificity factor MinE